MNQDPVTENVQISVQGARYRDFIRWAGSRHRHGNYEVEQESRKKMDGLASDINLVRSMSHPSISLNQLDKHVMITQQRAKSLPSASTSQSGRNTRNLLS